MAQEKLITLENLSTFKTNLENQGYITQETDPTVPSWAKASTKPTYTATEVKAVSTEANQGLTETEQANARANIGVGEGNLTLGETSTTAYRGDRGKAAYDHASDANKLTTTTSSGLYKIGATSEGHISSLTAVEKSDITRLGIPAQDTTYSSKTAVSGGIDVSLVTTGEKYIWNNKSDFSGSYSDLADKPTLGTAAAKNVPTDGNASTTEVVMGNDSRLTNSRNAADVYSWAKASTKPTYTASEVGAIASTLKGAANGVAELDSSGKVPSSQLPSYVDDVLEYANLSSFPTTGEAGKIYVAKDTNKTYRWTGSTYVSTNEGLALGETSSTAYRGDRGKVAYDHASDANKLTTATSSGLYKVASTANGHIASLTAVQKSDITALGIPSENTTYSSKTAASGGTDVSLVTTGEKYIWNNKSNFSGNYSDLSGKPTLGTAAAKDIPSTGDASTTQVVIGNDSRLTNSRTPTSHTHGNIQNGGALQTTDITIASGDKLVVTDSSDSSKLARTSVSFDGSTATQCLTKKGTWASFTNNSGTVTKVSTGVGLTGGDITGTGTIKAKLRSETALTNDSAAATETSGRIYPVAQDKSGYLAVNVPWSNTTYTPQKLGIGYGTCSTAAATTAKAVTLTDYVLVKNGIVAIKFTYTVPASATMNINSKGAKAIYYRGSAITADIIKAGDTGIFIYDGTQYHLLGIDTSPRSTFTFSGSTLIIDP